MRQAIPHGLLPIAGRLALAYLALTAVWAGLGLLLTGALAGTWVGPLDRDVAGWLVGRRTALLDGWSQVGSMLAETMVKVIVTAVIAVVMLLVWRSWREPFLVSFALILEAAVFITVTWLVARPRPDVPASRGKLEYSSISPRPSVCSRLCLDCVSALIATRPRPSTTVAVSRTGRLEPELARRRSDARRATGTASSPRRSSAVALAAPTAKVRTT